MDECGEGQWPDDQALRRRELELQKPGIRWWSDYGPGDKIHVLEWRRGFAEVVASTCESWLTHGPTIVRCQPVLEVKLTDQPIFAGFPVFIIGRDEHIRKPIAWARGPHPKHGLTGLPPLEE